MKKTIARIILGGLFSIVGIGFIAMLICHPIPVLIAVVSGGVITWATIAA